jgi:hypothetical protein
MIGILLIRMATLAAPFVYGFRAADNQLATHVVFVVQFGDSTLGFVDGLHLDKGKSLRFLGVLIGNDFHVLDRPDAAEKLEEIPLGRLKGQVADVNARRRDFDNFRFSQPRGTDWPFGARGVAVAGVWRFHRFRRRRGFGTLAQQKSCYLLPPGFFLGRWQGRFLSVAGPGSSAAALF